MAKNREASFFELIHLHKQTERADRRLMGELAELHYASAGQKAKKIRE